MLNHWWLEISQSGSIYTIEMGRYYKRTFFFLSFFFLSFISFYSFHFQFYSFYFIPFPLFSFSLFLKKQLTSIQGGVRDSDQKWPGRHPWSSVVKSLPTNTGDTGLILVPEGSHMPQSSQVHAPQLSILRSTAWGSQPLSSCVATTETQGCRARTLQPEKPPQ